MTFLILNAGSSSLKFSLIDQTDDKVWTQGVAKPTQAVRDIVDEVRARSLSSGVAIDGVAHRVVHGGTRFTDAVPVTQEVRAALAGLSDLAPLHNPPSLAVIDAALEALPDIPHVAVFDTAFHATLAPEAFTYPLPHEWNQRWGLRRFGFHGLNHAYCAERAAQT